MAEGNRGTEKGQPETEAPVSDGGGIRIGKGAGNKRIFRLLNKRKGWVRRQGRCGVAGGVWENPG